MACCDGGLAGLVGPADDGQPRGGLELERRMPLEVGELESGDAHRQGSVTWSGSSSSRRRPSRRTWRACSADSSSPLASALAMRARTSATNRPATVSAGSSGVAADLDHRAVADAHVQERRCQGPLQLVDVDLERVGSDAVERDMQHEVGVGQLAQPYAELGLAHDGGGVDRLGAEDRPAHAHRLDVDAAVAAGAVLEAHEAHVAGTVLVHRDRLGRTGVGPGGVSGTTAASRSASAPAPGSPGRWRRSRRR